MKPEPSGHLALPCPECGASITLAIASIPESINCIGCGAGIKMARNEPLQESAPAVCLVCNSPHLYWQKDFNQKLGCLLFALGAVFAPWTYFMSLMAMALLDLILYKLLPRVSVCYICKARYRKVPPHIDHLPFELITAQTWEARSENWTAGKLPLERTRPARDPQFAFGTISGTSISGKAIVPAPSGTDLVSIEWQAHKPVDALPGAQYANGPPCWAFGPIRFRENA